VEEILKELNDEQRAAVETTDGPIMVIAGAGSGKTRVLTYKVAYLLQKGIEPFNILALTFTNKAAAEMKERIIHLVNSNDARNVWMGTFHAIFARILRLESEKIGFPANFTIYDTDDSKSLIKSILKELNLDPKTYIPGAVLHRISLAKNNLLSPIDYAEDLELVAYDQSANKPLTGQIYQIYQARLRQSSAMDFDDLLFFTNMLLRDHPDALLKYQHKFKYILVDEYQDTNYSQYLIIKRLAANNENICVVGDDAQSIYAFRGASIQNIFNFQKDYPDFKIFKLEQNYRSTQNIIKAANSIILNNKQQIRKDLWTNNDSGPKITVLKASSDSEEGMLVAHSIFENKMNNQLENNAFAILYRTNAQSRAFEESLRKLNIPYKIYGGLSFYKRKEIRDLIAYFRLTINPNDQEALLRVINFPARGIGSTTTDKLIVAAGEKKHSIWELLHNLKSDTLGLNSGTIAKILEFVTKIKSFQVQLHSTSAFDLAYYIAHQSGIIKEIKTDETPEGVSRLENIEEILNAIRDFCDTPRMVQDTGEIETDNNSPRTLEEFLLEVSLLSDLESDEKKEDNNRVTMMTIHSAKGLEFPYVYIVGLEEDLFPSYLSQSSRSEIEEERRLFYVAVTRAMKKLTLAYAQTRYRWGNLVMANPSRFIEEIKDEFLDIPGKIIHNISAAPKKLKPLQPTISTSERKIEFEGSDINGIQTGMQVEHQSFGAGKVISVEGNGPNKKATVFFQSVGQKQLLLRFAKLRIIDQGEK
jgi:DNA helicase-2/ATP-dependent DNA helicase PcrA